MLESTQMARTLRAQAVSMLYGYHSKYLTNRFSGVCWTPQPDLGVVPASGCDGSFLIVGNRGGSVMFLR